MLPLSEVLTLVVVVSTLIVVVWATGTITRKMGYSRALGLLWLCPLVNFLFLVWIARASWPLETEVVQLRANAR